MTPTTAHHYSEFPTEAYSPLVTLKHSLTRRRVLGAARLELKLDHLPGKQLLVARRPATALSLPPPLQLLPRGRYRPLAPQPPAPPGRRHRPLPSPTQLP